MLLVKRATRKEVSSVARGFCLTVHLLCTSGGQLAGIFSNEPLMRELYHCPSVCQLSFDVSSPRRLGGP